MLSLQSVWFFSFKMFEISIQFPSIDFNEKKTVFHRVGHKHFNVAFLKKFEPDFLKSLTNLLHVSTILENSINFNRSLYNVVQ